jgi:MFS family permease
MTLAGGADDRLSARKRLLGLIAAIVTISVAGAGFGHSIPLYSILLRSYGASDLMIGLNTAFAAIAALAAAPFYPAMINRLRLKPFIFLCLALMVGAYWLLYLSGGMIWAWFPLRFIFSFAAGGLFVASEVWIHTLAKDENRGTVIGIYATCLGIGFASGPFMLDFTGYDGFAPFAAGMLVFTLALTPVLFAKAPLVEHRREEGSIFPLLLQAPVIFLACAVFAVAETSVLTFMPLAALEAGFAGNAPGRIITVFGIGGISLQIIIGRYADQLGRRAMLIGCTAMACVCAILLSIFQTSLYPLYITVFLLGAAVMGISSLGLTMLGDRYKGPQLAVANTAYTFMYGLGMLVGPALAGLFRQYLGTAGISILLSAILGCYLLLILSRFNRDLP